VILTTKSPSLSGQGRACRPAQRIQCHLPWRRGARIAAHYWAFVGTFIDDWFNTFSTRLLSAYRAPSKTLVIGFQQKTVTFCPGMCLAP
jgi:hypothetical protein